MESKQRSRRLRKKLRVGEFRELGFELAFEIRATVDDDAVFALLDALVEEAIEANGLRIAGLYVPDRRQRAQVALERPGSVTPEQRAAVEAWLTARAEVTNLSVGPLVDANTLGDTDPR